MHFSPPSYLNQINTQSTLLASCATAMLSAGELDAMDNEPDGIIHFMLNAIYVAATTMCLACSLWVIYTAMNLINLSIHSTLYGETMREIAEADQLIELRMKELRLVFVTSLLALVTAVMSMVATEADWPYSVLAFTVFVFTGWHATMSDKGTIILYERYTGLEVKDRWHGEKWREQIRDLLLPFGIGNHSSALRYKELRDKAESGISAFLSAGKDHKRMAGRSSDDSEENDSSFDRYGAPALRDALKNIHIKRARLATRTRQRETIADRSVKKDGILSLRGARGGTAATRGGTAATPSGDAQSGGEGFPFSGPQLMAISAELIQSVWRAGKVSVTREDWHGGWIWKTASGSGPVEKLREAWATLDANGTTAIPSVSELTPNMPRYKRWFVLNPQKGTLGIYTNDDDHRTGQPTKGEVKSISAYAAMRLASPVDGRLLLALLPRATIESRVAPAPSPAKGSFNGATEPSTTTPAEGKSWYLRAEDDAKTTKWFQMMEKAGAHVTDTVHSARLPPASAPTLASMLRGNPKPPGPGKSGTPGLSA